MQRSEAINELVTALAKAQSAFTPVFKETVNPAFHSKYADLQAIISATQPALNANGIAVLQAVRCNVELKTTEIETMLAHSSGQWMSDTLTLPATMRERMDAQSVGSSVTYGRRYGLQAMIHVAAEVDDDGNAAADQGSKAAAQAVGDEKRAVLAKVSVCHSPDETLFIYGTGVALIDTVLRSTGTKDLNGMWSVPAKDAQSVIQACIEKSIEVNEVPYAGQKLPSIGIRDLLPPSKATAGINVPPIPAAPKEDPMEPDKDLRCVRYMQRNGSYVLTGHTYGIKDEIKALKGRFDKPSKQWSIPTDMLGALKNICDEKGIELEGIA